MNKGTITYTAPGGGSETQTIAGPHVECMDYGDFTHLTSFTKAENERGRVMVEEWRVPSARVIDIHLETFEAAK